MRPIITLITDFGQRDYFVGSMKGVILSMNPDVQIVDISHEIRSHDIEEAAFVLKSAYRFFPEGTIHLVVVDPGVGSPRRPLVIRSPGWYFIGPDNGVMSYIYQEEKPIRVFAITAQKYIRPSPGSTFHGRDLFAPVAALLTRGVAPEECGPEVTDYISYDLPLPRRLSSSQLKGQVVYIDHFGNLISNITVSDISVFGGGLRERDLRVKIKGEVIRGLVRFYAAGGEGLGALINSSGHLEIYSFQGRAADILGVTRGEPAIVEREEQEGRIKQVDRGD